MWSWSGCLGTCLYLQQVVTCPESYDHIAIFSAGFTTKSMGKLFEKVASLCPLPDSFLSLGLVEQIPYQNPRRHGTEILWQRSLSASPHRWKKAKIQAWFSAWVERKCSKVRSVGWFRWGGGYAWVSLCSGAENLAWILAGGFSAL